MSLKSYHSLLPLAIGAAAVPLGVGIDAFVKYLAQSAQVVHIMGLRFIIGGLIAVAIFLMPKTGEDGIRRRRPLPSREGTLFHCGRAVLQLATAYLFFYGLTQLPLATATIIGFSAALMVPFIAWAVLKEKPTTAALVATIIGFGGTAFAASGSADGASAFQYDNIWLGAASCFAAAFIYAVVLVLLRLRAGREDAATMSVFTNAVPGLLLLPLLLTGDGPQAVRAIISTGLIFHIVALSLLGYSVWYLMSIAYTRAPAQQLATLEYTALIWSAGAGYLLFGELPGWQTWVGAAIVIAACLTVAAERHFITRKAARMPASTLPD